jgi:enoyl-CoA hydratase/carnithine racemase
VEEKPILVRKEKNLAWIMLNRPNKLNAMDLEMLDLLESALEEMEEDGEVRCILLKGSGDRAFSAGADIALVSTFSPKEAKAFSEKGQHVFAKIRELSKPVIAVVNGYALGGGCELALACDLRITSDKARFSQSEIYLGLMPGWGGTQILPRIVGATRAREMILSGRMLEASEAYNIGLVNRVVAPEKLDEEAVKLAEALASGPSKALAASKRLLNLSLQTPLNEGLKKESEDFSSLFSTEDFREGVTAYKEKRKPVFKGK